MLIGKNFLPALIFLLVFLMPEISSAQTTDEQITALRLEIDARKELMIEMDEELRNLRLERSEGFSSVLSSYYESYSDYYLYQNSLRRHAKAALVWQLFSSYVLLFVVVFVTGLGIILSFLEVRKSLVLPSPEIPSNPSDLEKMAKIENGDNELNNVGSTNLELSIQRVQITSAVTGVVILVISLGFLYLFVNQVLKLEPTDFISGHDPRVPSLDSGGNTQP